jgi:N-carbamoyl-L-amino-acid hydrolase
VGQLIVSPNSRNVIPGRVNMTVDLRSAQDATLLAMTDDLRRTVATIASQDRLEATLTEVVYFPPCHFDAHWVARIETLARELGHPVRRLASGAGHDAVYVARTCPSAMIFVPCEGGISHNEIENARPEHLAAGAQVLLGAVLEAAGGAPA